MVSKPTRGDNILNLFLTSNYTSVNTVQVLPGLSDHDVMIAYVSITPKMNVKNQDQFLYLEKQIGMAINHS